MRYILLPGLVIPVPRGKLAMSSRPSSRWRASSGGVACSDASAAGACATCWPRSRCSPLCGRKALADFSAQRGGVVRQPLPTPR